MTILLSSSIFGWIFDRVIGWECGSVEVLYKCSYVALWYYDCVAVLWR